MFEYGLGKQVVYRLAEGRYEFKVSDDKEWDVAKSPNMDDAAPSPPTPESEEKASADPRPVKI